VATILLLAMTVALFASIFVFVTTFPQPTPQNNNQFQATLLANSGYTAVLAIKIIHLSGPPVSGNALVYLKSAHYPSSEFPSPYTVASGLNGASTWNLGQVWNLTFPSSSRPALPDNITVYIVSGSNLLFSVILPGTGIPTPPTIISTWTSPAAPVVSAKFTVNATLAGSYNPNSVYVNLAAMPGGAATAVKMTRNALGVYGYIVAAGNTSSATPGTYYGFVNATSTTGNLTATAPVVITISASGTVNGPLSVGVVLVPSPPNSGTLESVQAVVTYTGPTLSSPAAVSVAFSATSSPAGYTFSGTGSGTISGPGGPASVTVRSLSAWTIPNPSTLTLYNYTVSATATVTGVGSITGTTAFTPATVVTGLTSGLIGSTQTVRGAGFVASSQVNLTLGGVIVTPSGTTNATCTFTGHTITVTSTGTFVCQFAVPNGAPSGATTLLATDVASGQNDTNPFTVTAWSITSSPTSGLMNSTVTLRGAGFVASTVVTLSFNGNAVVLASSCTFGTPSGSTVTVGANGSFVACTFPVPSSAIAGSDTIKATDAAGQVATLTYTVTAWTLTASPSWVAKSSSTTSVTLTGAGFSSGSKVSILYNGTLLTSGTLSFACSVGTVAGATITPSSGSFTCTLTLTKDPAGIYTFTATDYPSGQVAVTSVGRS